MAHGPSLECDVEEAASPHRPMRVVLAAPRGFCAGVRRAIDAVSDAIERHGPPVYVRRAIVHNLAVVRELEAKGAIFVQEVDEVPAGAVLILSAHGVSRSIANDAQDGDRRVIDATCPLVAKVHREVVRHHRDGRHVILIGHADHPEIEGTLGQLPGDAASVISSLGDVAALTIPAETRVAFAVQTTFSVEEAGGIADALKTRFADLTGPNGSDICYATSNRQAALRAIVPQVDAIVVVGESFSSNANRLVEVAAAQGCASVQLVAGPEDLDWSAFRAAASIGVTAAASTPESSVAAVLQSLRDRFALLIE